MIIKYQGLFLYWTLNLGIYLNHLKLFLQLEVEEIYLFKINILKCMIVKIHLLYIKMEVIKQMDSGM